MHELPVTESILEIAVRHARQASARHVVDIYLVIGDLASIVDDSVEFYWDIVAKDTIAEGARLHFRRLPVEIECLDCQKRSHPPLDDLACQHCGSLLFKVIVGREFYVEAINVENQDTGT
jgi:hydrogenase nickel incorporation protein HypA/HybF